MNRHRNRDEPIDKGFKYLTQFFYIALSELYSLDPGSEITVPEFIDPVFVKTSPKRSFSVVQNERFGLVFVKTGSIISGTVFR